ncbi:MAG: PAS domain S-box protein [Desulfurivibrio sp.]|nr:PAS domain S-box protein [Desulfurivibrio sp.]
MDNQELNSVFKRVVDTASVEFYLISDKGGFAYVNQAVVKNLGYSEAELLALSLADIDPEVGPQIKQCWAELKEKGNLHRETTHRTKSGQIVAKEVDAVSISLGANNYIAAFVRDITERKRVEAALRESGEQYRDLFESASDLIQFVMPDGRFLMVNPAWLATFGYSTEEVEQLTIFDLIDPDCTDHCMEIFQQVLEQGRVDKIDTTFVAKNGDKIMIQGAANCRYEDGKPQVTRCIFRNVTEEKRLQAQLLQSQKLEAVGRLTSGVAHDFNNLLTTILSYSELYLRRLPDSDPLADALRSIRDAGIRGAALTRQLLTFSRHQVVDVRVIDLNSVVSGLSTMIRRFIHPGIDFAVEVASCGEGRILADQHQIEQVLLNLAINARDAMADGGILTISCVEEVLEKIEFSDFENIEPGRYVVLVVSDTGEGMTKEVQEHIFEPFFTTKPQGKGTGLGLATAYGIIKQHSGYIVIESESGKGTTFRLYFPRVEAPVQTAVTSAALEVFQGSETILVVDDEPEILAVVRHSLGDMGYTVLTAPSAGEALLLVEEGREKIDLMLTDVIMPGMTGHGLATRVQAADPRIRVLFMSGYTDSMLEEQGVSRTHANFISKPLSPGELALKIRKMLA